MVAEETPVKLYLGVHNSSTEPAIEVAGVKLSIAALFVLVEKPPTVVDCAQVISKSGLLKYQPEGTNAAP